MNVSLRAALKSVLFVTTSVVGLSTVSAVMAQQVTVAAASDGGGLETVLVTAERTTRSSVVLVGVEAQKLLPGINPLKAIQTLPGVLLETADPWGNNEQNLSLYH